MNLANPPNNNPELLLFYLWKIIDLPNISLNSLLFKISYDLFLLPPDKAIEFINSCIENIKDWQKSRKNEIKRNINSVNKIYQLKNTNEKGKSTRFSYYLKSFVEKETLNRAVRVTDKSFDIKELDFNKGVILATVSGSKEDPYIIEIDMNKKYLKHDCHDFETRRSKNKQFCKHLAKFFLLVRDSHKASTELFLKKLLENLDDWNFIS
jgi:hypothetical protein